MCRFEAIFFKIFGRAIFEAIEVEEHSKLNFEILANNFVVAQIYDNFGLKLYFFGPK